MSQLPRISIIIPTLNQADFLERAICSVLDQGYDDLELLVMDGGSEDHTLDIIEMYESDLTHWSSEWDSGPAEAINKGIVESTGHVIAVLAADDVLLPGALEQVGQTFSQSKPMWTVGHGMRIGSADEMLGELFASLPETLCGFLGQDEGLLPNSTCFYRRSLLSEHGGMSTSYHFAFHYDLQCRLLASGVQPTLIPVQLAALRDHKESRSARQTLTLGEEYIDVAEQFADCLDAEHRYLLWKNCDERRRVYAMARAEAEHSRHSRFLWQQLLRRPWWLGSAHYRRRLLQGLRAGQPTSTTDTPAQSPTYRRAA